MKTCMALTELCEVSLVGAFWQAGWERACCCHKFITAKMRCRVSLGVLNKKQWPSADAVVYARSQESNPRLTTWSSVQKGGGAMGLLMEVSAHRFTLYANLSSLPLWNHGQVIRSEQNSSNISERHTWGPGCPSQDHHLLAEFGELSAGHDCLFLLETRHDAGSELTCCKSRQLPARQLRVYTHPCIQYLAGLAALLTAGTTIQCQSSAAWGTQFLTLGCLHCKTRMLPLPHANNLLGEQKCRLSPYHTSDVDQKGAPARLTPGWWCPALQDCPCPSMERIWQPQTEFSYHLSVLGFSYIQTVTYIKISAVSDKAFCRAVCKHVMIFERHR